MSAKRTPEQIAADLAKTPQGRNVRALLLRIADGECKTLMVSWPEMNSDEQECYRLALRDGSKRRLLDSILVTLTPLGRDVAEACRPKPWTTRTTAAVPERERCFVRRPTGEHALTVDSPIGEPVLGERIAALLTADDMRAAKRFEVMA